MIATLSLTASKFIRFTISVLLVNTTTASFSQLPDSILIIRNKYVHSYPDDEKLYKADTFLTKHKRQHYNSNGRRINKLKIAWLLSEIDDPRSKDHSLGALGIDTSVIANQPEQLLKYYNKNGIAWNQKQKEFMLPLLSDPASYKEEYDDYLKNGCCYTMHQSYRDEYIIQMYQDDKPVRYLRSRKHAWGLMMPWFNSSGDTLYNYNIERLVTGLVANKQKTKPPIAGNELLAYLVDKIVDNNLQKLYKLSAYSYIREIEELKTDFDIISFEEVYGRGRYIWNEPPTMKITLHNQSMLKNLNLIFLASKDGETIYSRNSVKRDYKKMIDRIQSIPFLVQYLSDRPDTRLDLYYFNNKTINDYNLDGFNKNPGEWDKYEWWVEILQWDSAHGIKLSFDTRQSIETSKRNNCGCNFRLDTDYLEQSLFFELRDEFNNGSIWILLPDNTAVLEYFQGDSAYKYSYLDYGTKGVSVQYACRKFNPDGSFKKELPIPNSDQLIDLAIGRSGLFVASKPIKFLDLRLIDTADYREYLKEQSGYDLNTSVLIEMIKNNGQLDQSYWRDAQLKNHILVGNRNETISLKKIKSKFAGYNKAQWNSIAKSVEEFNGTTPMDRDISYLSRPVFDDTKQFAAIEYDNGHNLSGRGGILLFHYDGSKWIEIGSLNQWVH